MPDLYPAPPPTVDPVPWAHAQLEWIDSQLTNYTQVRARHRADVAMYERLGAALPMRYHKAQVEHCTARIQDLLDMRLCVGAYTQGEGDTGALHPM